MSDNGNRSVSIGGDANGNIIQTGDGNTASLEFTQTTLPPAETVDLQAELTALRQILAALQAPDQKKIERALDDAEEEVAKAEPDRDEIGTALQRALTYAKKAEGYTTTLEKLQGHVTNVASWLGKNWHTLLAIVGLTT